MLAKTKIKLATLERTGNKEGGDGGVTEKTSPRATTWTPVHCGCLPYLGISQLSA